MIGCCRHNLHKSMEESDNLYLDKKVVVSKENIYLPIYYYEVIKNKILSSTKTDILNLCFEISKKGLAVLFPIFTMCLYVLYEILLHFGVYSSVFAGISSIVLYILPLIGMAFTYLKDRKASFEFWANAGAFAIIALTF